MTHATIVERFIGYIHWPLSRKAVLLGALGIAGTLVAGLVNYAAHTFTDNPVMALGRLDAFIAAWAVAQVAATLANVPAARAGREGRAMVYVFVAVQGVFMAALLHLFGTMATPIVAIFPALVILWTLVLDERMGLFGLAVMVPCIVVAGVLEAGGHIPFAPILLDRSVDAQRSLAWFGSVLFHIIVLMGVCLSLCILFLLSRRLQEQRLLTAHENLERANRLIKRYVPAQLADQIQAGHYQERTRAGRRRLTIVSVDVDNFTVASEALNGDRLDEIFNRYLAEMMGIADRHGGTTSVVAADALTILFGAPQATNDRDHAHRAVRMALEMQARAQALASLWRDHGHDRTFRLRIGITTGDVIVGDFGPEGRKLYAALGMEANIANRIRDACEPGRVVASRGTWALARAEFGGMPCGQIDAPGAGRPIAVYEIGPGKTAP